MSANTQSASTRSWRHKAYVAVPLIAAAGIGAVLLSNQPSPAKTTEPAPAVTVATPLVRAMNQWDDYIGRFAPSATVGIRARVSGPVTAIHFTDGQMVAKGQLLFSIDPRPFVAALDEARAGVADATSALVLAQANYVRAGKLVPDGAIPLKDFDASQARVQATLAALGARRRASAPGRSPLNSPKFARRSPAAFPTGGSTSATWWLAATAPPQPC